MKHSSYKKGYSALRKIINRPEINASRQFSSVRFRVSGNSGSSVMGIYNLLTDNLVAFVNNKGVAFVRPNSVYFSQLTGSSLKVVKNDNLSSYRSNVSRSIKIAAATSYYSSKVIELLIKNNDKPGSLVLFNFNRVIGINNSSFVANIRDAMHKAKLNNTLFSLDMLQFNNQDGNNIATLCISDMSEKIKAVEEEKKLKLEIANAFVNNISDIVTKATQDVNSMSSLKIKYEKNDGELVIGVLDLGNINPVAATAEFLVQYITISQENESTIEAAHNYIRQYRYDYSNPFGMNDIVL